MNDPTPEDIWPLVMAGCNAVEVAEYYRITTFAAKYLMMLAKRRHCIPCDEVLL